MDPDSRSVVVRVTDGRGRRVSDGGLARWLAVVAPRRARGEVGVALVSDARMRTLNRRYRGKDSVTDVLAFAGTGEDGSLGDIAIASRVARRQAREAGHSYQTELRVLALHGLLHLLGYDHEDPRDRGRMARAEARLRRKGGLAAGLIDRTNGAGTRRRSNKNATRLRPERVAGGKRREAAATRERERGWGPASTKKRLRPERVAGGKRREAAPTRERERGWGPASTKE